MLKHLPLELEQWAKDNGLECTKHSKYQWNVKEPSQHLIVAVYPGSGLMYLAEAHYQNLGVIDKTGEKRYFSTAERMIDELKKIIYAVDML